MNVQKLIETAKMLVADNQGLLAMDESNPTCNKRFAKLGIPQTEEARRAYRELIVTTPSLGKSISGVILYDETIRQQKKDGTPFIQVITEAGIIPGIKVDIGAKEMAGHPGEKITEGLDGLRDRLQEYFQMGARFAKWRTVITIAAEARHLSQAIADGIGTDDNVTVAVCPPFPYLSLVGEILKGSRIALGAQNLYPAKEGAFTGEVSPTMLLDLGCQYVILGHSERRHKLGESDAFINHKVRVALSAGLDAIFCIGETLEQRQGNQTKTVLERQLFQGLDGLSAATLTHLSIAYEPVWAIGSSGHHATPQQAQETHAVIRHCFGQMFGERSAQTLAIHYGGSVNPKNADTFLKQTGVDGVLIGGDSLNAEQFLAIVQAGISQTQSQVEAA